MANRRMRYEAGRNVASPGEHDRWNRPPRIVGAVAAPLDARPPPRPRTRALAASCVLGLIATSFALQSATTVASPPRPALLAAKPNPAVASLPAALAPLGPRSLEVLAGTPDRRPVPPEPPLVQLALLLPLPAPRSDSAREIPSQREPSPSEHRVARLRHKIHFNPSTRDDCLPTSLLGVIYDLAEKFGEVRILSTFRSPRHNARVGGASRSFHLECRAIDFQVAGSQKAIAEYLRTRPEVGGFKRYPLGFMHIDDGSRRTW